MCKGALYGIGVGPGDPELLTVKAFRKLQECPVIAYPKKMRGSKSYAYKIIEVYIRPEEKEMLGLVFPMTKNEEVLEREWNKAVDVIYEKIAQGKDVAFVTEGDPLLYSTFIHLMKVMKEKYPDVEIHSIPGISSVNGAVSRLTIPLADGDEQVAIIPANDDVEKMRKAIENHDAVVFLKVAKVIDVLLEMLRELGLENKAHVVTKVTSDEEILWNINELEGADLNYLSLMVVRK
jgi:precorrin-2/cobalt-factor-2 C20-methyltransferase